jgi:hypothetical protein
LIESALRSALENGAKPREIRHYSAMFGQRAKVKGGG